LPGLALNCDLPDLCLPSSWGFIFWLFFFFSVLGLQLRAYTLSHSTSPFLWRVVLR
jgi:hypothetical protein